MCGKWLFITLLGVIALCQSAFVDILEKNKCAIEDNVCTRDLYSLAFKNIAKSGLPEYGIPPLEPYEVKNVSVSVLGLVDIGMVDGVVKGIKDCSFDFVNTTLESLHSTMDVTCDITIKGRYKVLSDNPLTKDLLGGATVHGDGFAKLKIEKMRITFDFDFFVRENNGEIYIDWEYGSSRYQYDYRKVTFAANKLFFGSLEVSRPIMTILNDNWKLIMTTFAQPFTDTAMNFVDVYSRKFFSAVPAKFYVSDDLSPYKRV